MQRAALVSCLLWLAAGCAGSQAARPGAASPEVTPHATPATAGEDLGRKLAEQHRRIAELEARIGLLESEARSTRRVSAVHKESVRIGAPRAEPEPEPDEEELDLDTRSARAPRPNRVLRLYGKPSTAAEALPPLPVGDAPRLEVVPLPEERAKRVQLTPSTSGDEPLVEYRAGLRALRERRFDDAIAALSTFLATYPGHEMDDKATYWRAEAHYAKRDYELARGEFDGLLTRHPQSDKAPDALVKVGLCLLRLGDAAQAEAYFRRVREQYPKSQAAIIASREGST